MTTYKRYQVWALLYRESGAKTWQPLTAPLASKRSAQSVVDRVWLETKIEESLVDENGDEI